MTGRKMTRGIKTGAKKLKVRTETLKTLDAKRGAAGVKGGAGTGMCANCSKKPM